MGGLPESTPRKPAKAGLVPIPIVTRPFQRTGMHIVGLWPRTQRGNRFILNICDYTTRYPEAVALPSVRPLVLPESLSTYVLRWVPWIRY